MMETLLAISFISLLPAFVSLFYDSSAAKGFVGHFILGWQCVLFAACFMSIVVAMIYLFVLSVYVLVGD